MVLVDSCVWIEASKAQGDIQVKLALKALLDEAEAGFCGPIKLEVLGAARKERRKALSFFFEVVPYVTVQEKHWERAKELGWKLKDQGMHLPWNDVLIAAVGMEEGCRVYSVDKHFEVLRDLTGVILYRPGYAGGYNPE